VLENLRQAQGRTTDELYTYIYWQAWQALDEAGRQVLLVMPLAQGGLFAQIAALTGLPAETLSQALDRLVTLSLVETGGDLDRRRYRIHRLTETFLLNEVIKWQQGL
jgi:DNA-binding MarR family transcriptional regulator